MDCAEAKLQIEPYVAGEIADDVKGALEEHLAGCAECRLDSELTRASKNTPVGPDPNAAPAAFVESIRPEGAAAASPDAPRTGEAGEPPAGASQTPGGSWTLDSIFGAGGPGGAGGSAGGAAAPGALKDGAPPSSAATSAETGEDQAPSAPVVPLSERAAAAAEPLPEHELALPAVFDGPADRSADEPPESDAPTWDFEPADQKGSAKPPEGSLFFAEEALSRSGTAAKKKPGVPRIVLWGAGGLLGVGLLALSIWIAMTVRQPLPPASVAGRRAIRAGTGPESPGADGVKTPAATEPTPSVATPPDGPGPSNPAPTGSSPAPATAAAAGGATPEETRVTRGPDAATPGNASATPPPSAPEPAVTTPRTPPRTSQPPAATTPRAHAVTPSTRKPAPVQASTSTTHRTTTRTAPALTPPATTRPAPAAPPVDDDWHETTPVWPVPQTMTPGPAAGTDAGTSPRGGATRTGAATNPAGTANPSGGTGAAEPPATGSAPAAEPSAETVNGPIDRLHLATLNAEQKADVVALRKLREAWRGVVRTSIGPDRQRAKRELADCLWALQTLTTKSSDQKEALAAYRDYVLNAPAGGADARTIARMRQLEDAVAESH